MFHQTTLTSCQCRRHTLHRIPSGILAPVSCIDQIPTRRRSTQSTECADASAAKDHATTEFTKFFYFPHIRWVRAVARLKIYQTAATMLMLPPMCYSYTVGAVDLPSLQAAFGVATFAGIMLYGITGYTRNFIGMLSLNEAEDVVRISHLTFWGGRNDIYAPVEDVIPLADLSENPRDIYLKCRRYSTKDVLYFTLRAGGIQNMEKFVKVFGSIDL